jgi:hypothetical protein
MKIARKLSSLEASALWALRRSSRPLAHVLGAHNQTQRELLISPLVINTLNTWSLFNRTYYICCLLGAWRRNGTFVSSSITASAISVNDAIGYSILHFKTKAVPLSSGNWDTRDEPTWHDSNTLIALATKYAFSNLADIQTAYSFGFTAHKNLVVFRNYYAHRNRGTKERAQNVAAQYGIRTNQHPSDILLDYPLSTPGSSLLQIWLGELQHTIALLCS